MNNNIFLANLLTPGLNGRWGMPRVYWGPPGVAKSAKVRSLVNSLGMDCKVILASLRDPSDFNGIPVPEVRSVDGKETTVMTMAPPDWAHEAAEAENCVVFFDEISTASPSVQAALLRVILDGAVGDVILPAGVRFIAAANPTDMAAGGFDMSTPLANRFGHEEVNLSPDGGTSFSLDDMNGWCDWMLTSGDTGTETIDDSVDIKDRQKTVMARWADEYAQARGEIVGFMHSAAGGPSVLFKMPDVNDPRASRAWASPRSWECATRALASARIQGLSDIDTDKWLMSHVGTGPIAQLRAHMANADLPKPRDFLASGGKGFTHDKTRLDRTMALLAGCSGLVCSMEAGSTRDQYVEALWVAMTPIAEQSTDCCVPAVRALIAKNLAFGKAPAKPLAKMRPVLKAVGVLK